MRTYQFKNGTEAYLGVFDLAALENPPIVDFYSGSRFFGHHLTLLIENPEFHIGIEDSGFTAKRWGMFQRHYLDPESLWTWFDKATVAAPEQVVAYQTPQNFKHKHGNCILSMVASTGYEPELIIYSRAVTWAPVGVLDVWLACLTAQELARRWEKPVKIRWHISQIQFSFVKALPFLFWSGRVDLESTYPKGTYYDRVQRYYLRALQRGGDLKFRTGRIAVEKATAALERRAAGEVFPWGTERFQPELPPRPAEGDALCE